MNDLKSSGGSTPQPKPAEDVVGIELGSGHAEGTPVARLRRGQDGRLELVAAALLPLDSRVPEAGAAPLRGSGWALPKAFQAPSAAMVISSEEAVLRQASGVDEALADKDKAAFRTQLYAKGGDSLPFVAAVPEHVAAWAARLLPEGRRPTAVSIQVADMARLNAFAVCPSFTETNGTALLLIAGATSTALAIFHEFEPILYRKHSIGNRDVLEAVCRKMNLDEGTARQILNDTLVDPTPVIEPVLGPLFRQAEMSADYAVRMKGCFIDRFFLCGQATGIHYWAEVFKSKTGAEIVPCNPALEMPRAPDAILPPDFEAISRTFTPAIGGAAAAMEDA